MSRIFSFSKLESGKFRWRVEALRAQSTFTPCLKDG